MGKRLAKDLPGAVKARLDGTSKNEAYRPVRPYPETLYDQRERKLKKMVLLEQSRRTTYQKYNILSSLTSLCLLLRE